MSATQKYNRDLSWKMKNRPGSWRKPLSAPSPILSPGGPQAPTFPFQYLPFDLQETVLRYLPMVDLIPARAVSATFIIVYEGVACTEFVALAGVSKPKFSTLAHEFQFLYRCRHLQHPTHVTPLLLWAAARDHSTLIQNVLQRSLGRRVEREDEQLKSGSEDERLDSVEALLDGVDRATADRATDQHPSCGNGVGVGKDDDITDIMTMDLLRGANGVTPLHVACRNDHVQSTLALIKAGGDVLARDHKLQTPFYHACALGQGPAINIVRTILKHCHFLRTVVRARKERDSYDPTTDTKAKIRDIDLNMVSSEGKTCLYAAAERGHPGVVRTLLIAGGHMAVRDHHCPVEDQDVPQLGALDLEKSTSYGTPLGVACAGGKKKTVKLLLQGKGKLVNDNERKGGGKGNCKKKNLCVCVCVCGVKRYPTMSDVSLDLLP